MGKTSILDQDPVNILVSLGHLGCSGGNWRKFSSSRLETPRCRMKFVFTVGHLLSRRCHKMSSIPELHSSPS